MAKSLTSPKESCYSKIVTIILLRWAALKQKLTFCQSQAFLGLVSIVTENPTRVNNSTVTFGRISTLSYILEVSTESVFASTVHIDRLFPHHSFRTGVLIREPVYKQKLCILLVDRTPTTWIVPNLSAKVTCTMGYIILTRTGVMMMMIITGEGPTPILKVTIVHQITTVIAA